LRKQADNFVWFVKAAFILGQPFFFIFYSPSLKKILPLLFSIAILSSCSDKEEASPNSNPLTISSASIDGVSSTLVYDVNYDPLITIKFSSPVNRTNVPGYISFHRSGTEIPVNISYSNQDSTITIDPVQTLEPLTRYTILIRDGLGAANGSSLQTSTTYSFLTKLDNTDKFPRISDAALLDKVQQQTFKYFWNFGHPVSGMARERNTSGDLVTSGGTGFGIMAIIAAVNRNFITRSEAADRILRISNFLLNNCTTYHGAFAHWINGATGATIPFSSNDNGADLVETSYLMQGLLAARQYFNLNTAIETDIRNKVNVLWDNVDWNWFRQGNQNVLYWHWSPDKGWIMNVQIRGWNESLITYVLAASSRTHAIPASVYNEGWARNGGMRNNNTYYGYTLPLGPHLGGPLFFEHYSFLGINPNGLTDQYANYQVQTKNHTLINYEYCKANPLGWYGYSDSCWGLTASDIPNGYAASAPDNDRGVIAPTAALSSIPYTPVESMKALRFFYYKLGDKLWGPYGFYDAFKLSDPWFASSTLAIDQGPIIVMIENYRSGLLWSLFTEAPELKNGMRNLGFTAPYL